MSCRVCHRSVPSDRALCRRGQGCRREFGPGDFERDVPSCPTCGDYQAVVIFRPAGFPWYGGPWKPEAWRCVSCHLTWVPVLAASGTAG